MQPLKTGLGRAEAVVIGALTPASDEISVAKYLVAGKVGRNKTAELTLQLRGDICKESWLGPLCQQVGSLLQCT